MALNLKNSINWTLALPTQDSGEYVRLTFEQSISETDGEFGFGGLELLNLLQETFYVTSLDGIEAPESPSINPKAYQRGIQEGKNSVSIPDDQEYIHKNPEKKLTLDRRDKGWDTLIGFFEQLYYKITGRYNILSEDATATREIEERLFHLKGQAYKNYIYYKLGKIYALRYEIYVILNKLVPLSLRESNNVILCTNIICNGIAFQNFFNASLGWIEDTLTNLQTYEGKALDKLMAYLDRRYGSSQFRRKFVSGHGCFSKTLVFDGNTYTNALCFSGARNPSTSIQNACKRIADCGLFGNHYVVKISPATRYYISSSKYITLGEALSSGLYNPYKNPDVDGRMFSCCERKTFADYNWSGCQWFRMVVKYTPCQLCQYEVGVFENKFRYPSKVVGGKALTALKNLATMNQLATEIHRKMYTLLLPYYP